MKKKNLLFNILFYFLLIALIGVLLYPHIYTNKMLMHLPFSLHLNHKRLVMAKGQKAKLNINAINKRVTYKSTDFSVAYVTFNGWIKARRTGKAVIKAKTSGKQFKCYVTVVDINKSSLELKVRESYKLKIKGTYAKVTWSSSNNKVVTVSKSGKVVAVSKGNAIIKANVRGISIKCTVTVR